MLVQKKEVFVTEGPEARGGGRGSLYVMLMSWFKSGGRDESREGHRELFLFHRSLCFAVV